MVKRGTKRKIDIEKITNKRSKATTFTKRLNGLYSKASQLCMMTGAQIAILSTPSSSNSNIPFYSFGHSSVNAIVSAYLSGKSLAPVSEESKEMREDFGICMARSDLGLGQWWDDERVYRNHGEVNDDIELIKCLLNRAERLRAEEASPDQTLITDDDDDLPANFSDKNKALSPEGNLDEWSDMELDQLLKGFDADLCENLDERTEQEDHHIVASSENCCNNDNALLQPAGNFDDDEKELIDLDFPANFNAGHDEILSVSDNNKALSPAGNLDDWSDIDLDQLMKGFDDENLDEKTEELEDHQIVASPENCCNDNNKALSPSGNLAEWSDMDLDQLLNDFDDDLHENVDEKTEQVDHQRMAVPENCCNNNFKALLQPAANFDDEQELLDLDFESICEGLEDLDYLMDGY